MVQLLDNRRDASVRAIRPLNAQELTLRTASAEDGSEIWKLVNDTGVLDVNSSYAYVLLCDHFSETCVVAEQGGRVVGFVTAYCPPGQSDTIFVWQVGVARIARKQGIAKKLLRYLLKQPACEHVSFLETTISPSNQASQRLFRSFARDLSASCNVSEGFSADLFQFESHEPEHLYRIGPFRRNA